MKLLDKVVHLENSASDFGFRWEKAEQIMEQIHSECAEIKEHLDNRNGCKSQEAALQEEIGDLLHAVFSLCVFCNYDPRETLEQTLTKFERRLGAVKCIAGQQGLNTLEGKPFEELMRVWKKAKQLVG